jgi:hypothetical protein
MKRIEALVIIDMQEDFRAAQDEITIKADTTYDDGGFSHEGANALCPHQLCVRCVRNCDVRAGHGVIP